MKTRVLGTAALLCTLGVAGGAAAQEAPADPPAAWPTLPARVRLTTADGRRTFELVRVEADGLVGRDTGRLQEPERTVPLREVLRVEASRGHRRGRNAAIGALVGVAVGAIFLVDVNKESSAEGCNVGACVPLFLLPPAALGAGLGAAISRERWDPVDPRALRRQPAPGLTTRVTLRF